jgi:hypothetical protein
MVLRKPCSAPHAGIAQTIGEFLSQAREDTVAHV